ncbi:MAG TPA: 16S rRNA (cytosine(1402)-N(4))-methyltransferase RsmH [Coxiellaceae bacterium]|nr:16S rRNA (cytosine(1402)-N(4))-methyltransferase RsmH [Coxiellaceae bacterium]
MFVHQSVLLAEAIAGLAIKKSGIYVDATFGRGGHSRAILEKLGPTGRLIAIDLDPEAIAVAKKSPFFSDTRFEIVQASFSELETLISQRDWLGQVDGVLLDLGVSSPQIDDPARGFSFMREGPLDMRMNPATGIDAMTWINGASASDIATVLFDYGEERFSRRIAQAIVHARDAVQIKTTTQLADIIKSANPSREKNKHPATRSFQAIRIFINKELDELKTCLPQAVNALKVGGRLSVISFHSLEDRIVKQFIQRESKGDDLPPHFPVSPDQMKNRLRKIGSSVLPSDIEIKNNPRARSARLRIAEKISAINKQRAATTRERIKT